MHESFFLLLAVEQLLTSPGGSYWYDHQLGLLNIRISLSLNFLDISSLPLKSKLISIYFPNLEELSFLFVCAFPNDSRISLDCKRTSLTLSISSCWATFVTYNIVLGRWLQTSSFLTLAMYLMITLLASVLPLPDSPEHIISNTCSRYHSWLTWYDNAGVLSIPSHRFVGSICYGKYVGRPFEDFSTFIENQLISFPKLRLIFL